MTRDTPPTDLDQPACTQTPEPATEALVGAACDRVIARYTGTHRSDDDIRFALRTMKAEALAALPKGGA